MKYKVYYKIKMYNIKLKLFLSWNFIFEEQLT